MEAASCRSRAEWKSIETAKGVVTLLGISLVKCTGVDEDEVVCRNALALIRSFRKVLDQLLSIVKDFVKTEFGVGERNTVTPQMVSKSGECH